MANLTDVFISAPTGLLSKLTGFNINIFLRIIAVHVGRINHGANRAERTFTITWLCSKRFFNFNANDMPLLPVLWMSTVVLSFQLNSTSLDAGLAMTLSTIAGVVSTLVITALIMLKKVNLRMKMERLWLKIPNHGPVTLQNGKKPVLRLAFLALNI
nr:hypothetical protein [Shewanella algidipiscicola]